MAPPCDGWGWTRVMSCSSAPWSPEKTSAVYWRLMLSSGRAGLFVLLSHYEGFGFTVLEAMGCGVPVVIANRASLPEIAGDAALAVEPDDAEAAANALYHALSDSALRQSLIERGLKQAARFS